MNLITFIAIAVTLYAAYIAYLVAGMISSIARRAAQNAYLQRKEGRDLRRREVQQLLRERTVNGHLI